MTTFEKINNWLKNNTINNLKINELSKKIQVSTSSISRYVQFRGFPTFQIFKDFNKKSNYNSSKHLNIAYSLSRTHISIDVKKIKFVAKKIVEKDHVVILGESFTFNLANIFERKLIKIDIDAKSMNVASDLNILSSNSDTIYIFISNSGKNGNVKKLANKIHESKRRGMIISITSNNYSNIENISNETIKGFSQTFYEQKNEYELPSISQIVSLYILDCIFDEIYKINKEKNDFFINQITILKSG